MCSLYLKFLSLKLCEAHIDFCEILQLMKDGSRQSVNRFWLPRNISPSDPVVPGTAE